MENAKRGRKTSGSAKSKPSWGGANKSYQKPIVTRAEKVVINYALVSPFQQTIFDHSNKSVRNLVVKARAGSGKTTTITWLVAQMPKHLKIVIVAFNTVIKDELLIRTEPHIDVCTLNSLGYRAMMMAFKRVAFDKDKGLNIAKNVIGYNDEEREKLEAVYALRDAVSKAKGMLCEEDDDIDAMIDAFDIDTCGYERKQFIQYVKQAMHQALINKASTDYDDQIYIPVKLGLKIDLWDRVLVDETQDLNAAQIKLALAACKKGGKIIAVGDPQQAIYQFRGADEFAVDNVIKELDAEVLPLSVTYRCAKNIVKEVNDIVPDLVAPDFAPDGKVITIEKDDIFKHVKPGDFILSRTNAPLIGICLKLISNRVPANIRGRDIGENLLTIIKRSKAKTVPAFMEYLDKWANHERQRLTAANRDVGSITDKEECLNVLCEGAKNLTEVKDNIDALFTNKAENDVVILSTVHKAKGLERNTVFLLTGTFRKGKGAAEDNIWYVACTRAKSTLYYAKGEVKGKRYG